MDINFQTTQQKTKTDIELSTKELEAIQELINDQIIVQSPSIENNSLPQILKERSQSQNQNLNQNQIKDLPASNNSFGVRMQLVSELAFGKNHISIFRFKNKQSEVYSAEIIKKEENTQLLILPGSLAYKQQNPKMTVEYYGVRSGGVSGFIKSQVTGESFVMTEVKGLGSLRLATNNNILGLKSFRHEKLYLPNNNIAYLQALMGTFEISPPIKNKAFNLVTYTELRLNKAIALLECDSFYELEVFPNNSVEIETSQIVFWTGDLLLDEAKNDDEGNLVRFSGSGKVYLSLEA